jgi:hypothetical protein
MKLKRNQVRQYSSAPYVSSTDLRTNTLKEKVEYSGVSNGMLGGSTALSA